MRRYHPPVRRAHRRSPASALILAVAAALASFVLAGSAAAQQIGGAADSMDQDRLGEPTIIYLVRHAETAADGTRNPPLSEDGEARARWLAVILSHARLDAVYSTDFDRTLETAGWTAEANGVQTDLYDPTNLAGFARRLLNRGGRALVVGHSNTTPALVAALGGEGGSPIQEWEHDRLYTLVIRGDSVRTVVLTY